MQFTSSRKRLGALCAALGGLAVGGFALLTGTPPAHGSTDKVGINLGARNYPTENGDQSGDPSKRPWVWADSVTDAGSLTSAANPWNPAFLSDMKGNFSILRTMEWVPANNCPIAHWSDRRQKNEWPQISGPVDTGSYENLVAHPDQLRANTGNTAWGVAPGVAWEWIADLSNRTQANLWVNIPHLADDDYVKSLADLLRDQLTQGQTVTLEYSNEVWNTGSNFIKQHDYIQSKGYDSSVTGTGQSIDTLLSNAGVPDYGGSRALNGYYAFRSAQIWTIFKNEWGGQSNRLKFTLAGLTNDAAVLQAWKQTLSSSALNPNGLWPTYLARGWYPGYDMTASDGADNSDQFWTGLNNRLADYLATDYSSLHYSGDKAQNIQYNKDQISQYFNTNTPLVAYEFGIQIPPGYINAAKDARERTLWNTLVSGAANQLAQVNLYSYSANYNQYISILALKQFVGQDPAQAYSWQGVMDFINGQGGSSGSGGTGGGGGATSTGNLLVNPNFEADHGGTGTPTGWLKTTDVGASYVQTDSGAHGGACDLANWSSGAFKVYTYQIVSGLAQGLYTVSAWYRGGGSFNGLGLNVKGYDATGGTYTDLSGSLSGSWQQVTVPSVNVTTGQIEIGFWTDAAAQSWVTLDDISLSGAGAPSGLTAS